MPPRRRKELSLGAACFELPAAPDCELPKEPSPAAWRIQFFNDEGDKELFGGLAISCSAGRTLALQNAPRYFLPLRMDMKLSRRAWQLLLKKAADSLSKRQGRPSSVIVFTDIGSETTGQSEVLLMVPDALKAGGDAVTELQIEDDYTEAITEGQTTTQFVIKSSAVFPNLAALDVPTCILPPPTKLPKLTHFGFRCPEENEAAQVYASLHPFFPQLRSLGIHNNRMLRGPPVWKHVISCAAPALQYFTTHYHLTDELLGLLLKHAPGIKQLGIGGLGLQESHRDKTWKVENLNIDQAWDSPEVGQLALLPAREEGAGKVEVRTGELPPARDMGLGKLCVRSRESWISRIRDTEGFSPELVERWPEFTLVLNNSTGPLAPGLHARRSSRAREHYNDQHVFRFLCLLNDPTEQQLALGNIMRQLATVQEHIAGADIEFMRWAWSPALAGVLAAGTPALSHLKFKIHMGQLTDAMLGMVVLIGPRLKSLSVEMLGLQTEDHASKAWPCDEFYCFVLDLRHVLRLPDPAAGADGGRDGGRKVVINASQLTMNADLTEDEIPRIRERLSHIICGPKSQVHSLCIVCHAHLDPTQHTPTLLTQLSLLSALEWKQKGHTDIRITLPLTQPTMEALSQLPEGVGVVDLSSCKWPLKPADYRSLAEHVPVSYTCWILSDMSADSALFKAITAGIEKRREGLGLEKKVNVYLIGSNGKKVKPGKHWYLQD